MKTSNSWAPCLPGTVVIAAALALGNTACSAANDQGAGEGEGASAARSSEPVAAPARQQALPLSVFQTVLG
ncbi:MAG: hypothetical protein ABI589_15555, partial [Burkholderiales bacterium]